MTEFKWYEGSAVKKLYLSAILDLYDQSIVAYIISGRNDNKLVFDTFEQAIRKNPEAHPLFHSDRGSSIPVKRSSSSSRIRVWSNPCPALGIASIIAQWKGSGEL